MLTKTHYSELLTNSAPLENAAKELLAKLAALSLTPSTDLQRLKDEYKVLLFSKLMAADKGLKMRYEMHRTEAAKLELINSTVSLEGYEEVEELAALLIHYTDTFASQSYYFNMIGVTAETFLADYSGSVEKAAGVRVIDVTDTDIYRHFKTVADALNELHKSGALEPHQLNRDFYHRLAYFLPVNALTEAVEVNEEGIYHQIVNTIKA